MRSSQPSFTFSKNIQEGKLNPKSKKLLTSRLNKDFLEDSIFQPKSQKVTSEKFERNSQRNRKKQSVQTNKRERQMDKTEKKQHALQIDLTNHEKTAPKKKKQLKRSSPSKSKKEYIYIFDSHSDTMKKHLIIQGQDINEQLDKMTEFIPPLQTCDEDCDSTEEVVRMGVERSKRDLFETFEFRRRLKQWEGKNRLSEREKPQSDADKDSYDGSK